MDKELSMVESSIFTVLIAEPCAAVPLDPRCVLHNSRNRFVSQIPDPPPPLCSPGAVWNIRGNSDNDEYKLILILEVMLMAFEMVKNEDTHSQEMDMEDKTQRIMFLTLGIMMVLAAAFLYLLCH